MFFSGQRALMRIIAGEHVIAILINMVHSDMLLHIFVFLLRVNLIIVVGIVLHHTEGSLVLNACPGLWETMALALVVKSLRLTLCAVAFKSAHNPSRTLRWLDSFDLILHAFLFIIECVTTSRALNTHNCVLAAGESFDGHPLIAYVNGVSCVWDGNFVLSYALFAILNR